MKRRTFTGGLYTDALPTGEFASLIRDAQDVGLYFQTSIGQVPLPPVTAPGAAALYTRISAVKGFRIAVQSAAGNLLWEWTAGHWTNRQLVSYGTQGHIYNPAGELYVISSPDQQESQGIRYWDNGPVLGTPTYNYLMPFAKQKGVKKPLCEWTAIGDGVFIGQAEQGPAVAQLPDGTHRVLELGDCHFVQAHRAGHQLTVATAKFKQREAVVLWLTMEELTELPVLGAATPTPEEPPVTIPNHVDVVKKWRAVYKDLAGPERAGRIVNAVAWDLRGEGAGTFFKDAGDNWNHRSMDVIIYKPGGETFDILGDAEGNANPGWARTKPTGFGAISKWRAAVEPELGPPEPPPPPPPPSDEVGEMLDNMEAAARGILANVAAIREELKR